MQNKQIYHEFIGRLLSVSLNGSFETHKLRFLEEEIDFRRRDRDIFQLESSIRRDFMDVAWKLKR